VEIREVGGGAHFGDAAVELTVDASVFVAALRPGDVNHADSLAMVTSEEYSASRVLCPTLVVSECAGSIARVTHNPLLGHQAIVTMTYAPNLSLVELTED
jgi:predicted nucleic acid-binding protein